MSEFKIIETQEELDAVLSGRLKREKEKYEALIAEAKAETDRLKVELGESQKALAQKDEGTENLRKTIEELKGKVGDYELTQLKTSIALQKGIPYDLADRLNGTDAESLTADAERLASYMTGREPVAPLKSQEASYQERDSKEAALLKLAKTVSHKGE